MNFTDGPCVACCCCGGTSDDGVGDSANKGKARSTGRYIQATMTKPAKANINARATAKPTQVESQDDAGSESERNVAGVVGMADDGDLLGALKAGEEAGLLLVERAATGLRGIDGCVLGRGERAGNRVGDSDFSGDNVGV